MYQSVDEALDRADLPALVARYFPESGARPGRADTVRAVWRGEKKPSFSLFTHEGRWFFRDHATGQKGNAWHFLTEIVGLSKEEALRELGISEPRGDRAPQRNWEEELAEAQERLKRWGRVPEEMKGRGLSFEDLVRLGFGVTKQGTLIPILDPEGKVVAVKRRSWKGTPRYSYLRRGMPAVPWHSPGFGEKPRPVLVVEGELNAISAWVAFPEFDYVGVPGFENSPRWDVLAGRSKVFLAADDDEAGRKALARWREEARAHGIFALALKPLDADFCDLGGKGQLRELLDRIAAVRYAELVGFSEEIAAMVPRLGGVLAVDRSPAGLRDGRVIERLRLYADRDPVGLLSW